MGMCKAGRFFLSAKILTWIRQGFNQTRFDDRYASVDRIKNPDKGKKDEPVRYTTPSF